MGDNDDAGNFKISRLDDSVPATLLSLGKSVWCATLREAVIAWGQLSDGIKKEASIRLDDRSGTIYHGWEIDKL